MNNQISKRAVVVLGAGRTGTSLLMNVLAELKMSVSEIMTPPSEQNRQGGFEDSDIFSIQNEIIEALDSSSKLPLPDNWLSMPIIQNYQKRLETILLQNIKLSPSIFGFKDPKTAILIPLWFKIFNRNKIVPLYILSVRNPQDTVISLAKNYDYNYNLAELFWMHKNCSALLNTGSNCFIVHYEDWFTRPTEQARDLLRYTALDQYFTSDVGIPLKNVIKPNLNRAIYEDYEVKNEYVIKLYDILKECRGDSFDRVKLMSVVKECQKAMDGFKGWYLEAHKTIKQLSQTRILLNKERRKAEELGNAVKEERSKTEKLASIIENERRKKEELASIVENERSNTEELLSTVDNRRKVNIKFANTASLARNKNEKLEIQSNKIQTKFFYKLVKTVVKQLNFFGWKLNQIPCNQPKKVILFSKRENFNLTTGDDQSSDYIQSALTEANRSTDTYSQDLEMARQTQKSLLHKYELAEAQIAELEKEMSHSTSSEAKVMEISEAVLVANKLLLDLKYTEGVIDDLRNCCENINIKKRPRNTYPNQRKKNGIWQTFKKKCSLRRPDSDRMRRHLKNAWKKPGKNTMLLPIRLTRHFLEIAYAKKLRKPAQ